MRKMLFVLGMMITVIVNGQWSELGGANTSTFNNNILSIAKDNIGNIYVGGSLKNDSSKQYVAKWDGTNWSELGGVNSDFFDGDIKSLLTDNLGNLYVCGSFNFVAKWDGVNWTRLTGNNNFHFANYINSITIDSLGNIYAGGNFKNLNGKCFVAKWDGTNWTELGSSIMFFNNIINTVNIDSFGNIYAGGNFRNSNGKCFIAKWNGAIWSQLGSTSFYDSTISTISKIIINKNNDIYFSSGVTIVKWDGFKLETFLTFLTPVNTISNDTSGNLYVANEAFGSSHYCVERYIAYPLNYITNTCFPGTISALICDNKNTIYAAGYFTNGLNKNHVAVYPQNILPIKLLSFNSKLQTPKSVALNWQTANEVNVSHFNIQRSVKGNNFITIGNVAANNKSFNEYYFTDELIPKDQNLKTIYYRIESVDKDGSKTFSTIQQITIKPQTPNIIIFPNPAKDIVTIECKGAKELMIVDYLGRTVTNKKIINNQLTIMNVQRFIKGIYVVKVIMSNGDIKTEKLILE